MKRITREWVEKAEDNWFAARQLHRARKHPQRNLVCFLSQQCVELYLKARLKEAGIKFHKTHDLPYLLRLASKVEPAWRVFQPQANALNDYAVDSRYPGKSATKAEAKQALKDCGAIQAVRAALGLPPD